MSILIHTCSFPCSIRVTACPPPPPLHPTTPIVRRKTTFTRRRGLCKKSTFARRSFCEKVFFREEYHSSCTSLFHGHNPWRRVTYTALEAKYVLVTQNTLRQLKIFFGNFCASIQRRSHGNLFFVRVKMAVQTTVKQRAKNHSPLQYHPWLFLTMAR